MITVMVSCLQNLKLLKDSVFCEVNLSFEGN